MAEREEFYQSMPTQENRKRAHDQMSRENIRTVPNWLSNFADQNNSLTAPPSSTFPGNLTLPLPRYSGDGLDLRRPIMSQPSGCVIDLTTEPDSPPQPNSRPNAQTSTSTRASRLPRYSRDIIDLDPRDDEYGELPEILGGPGDEPVEIEEPDVQIIWSSRSNNPIPRHLPRPRLPPSRSHGIGLYVSTSRDGSAPQHLTGLRPRSSLGHHFQNFHNFLTRAGRNEAFNSEGRQRFIEVSGFRQPGRRVNLPPIDLDYDHPGFRIGTDPGLPPPPLPTYTSPPPARPGFTRSPQEDDILVCPNCNEELGIHDDELKRQVWVIKSCGHVYCGYCAKNRHKGKKSQVRTTLSKPFGHCVVVGCGKASLGGSKTMFQVYI